MSDITKQECNTVTVQQVPLTTKFNWVQKSVSYTFSLVACLQ